MSTRRDLVEQRAQYHRVLANPRRLRILWALGDGELSVGEIAAAIGASLQATSQHLRLMREHDMVCARRQGQSVYYHASPSCRWASLDDDLRLFGDEPQQDLPQGSNPIPKKEMSHD